MEDIKDFLMASQSDVFSETLKDVLMEDFTYMGEVFFLGTFYLKKRHGTFDPNF